MIFKGPAQEGFYVYSSCGCGEDSAIRIEHVQTSEETVSFAISPTEAKKLGKMLIEVAKEYEKGIESGIGSVFQHRN